MNSVQAAAPTVRGLAIRLEGASADYDALLEMTADKRLVLLGEATHGTSEFYRMRAEISARLIEQQGFEGIAIEGDWPDVERVDRYVQGLADDDADTALGDFERFPQWMWRNRDMRRFIGWLHDYNDPLPPERRIGIHGLDLYNLYRSADAVIDYLDEADPDLARLARTRYGQLDHGRDAEAYGRAVALHQRPSAQHAVADQMRDLALHAGTLAPPDRAARDVLFNAHRNAAVVVSAEMYYRTLYDSSRNGWNLRDAYMSDTLFSLVRHRQACGGQGRLIVWAHNSHVGDARATEMHNRGEWTLGQLVRRRAPRDAVLVGFTTYTGHVAAASGWGRPVEHQQVRPAISGSCEHLFHSCGLDRFFMRLTGTDSRGLLNPMLERAIGVVYRPQSERFSHYFLASLPRQFDAVFHIDETAALEPLDAAPHWPGFASADHGLYEGGSPA